MKKDIDENIEKVWKLCYFWYQNIIYKSLFGINKFAK